MPTGYTADIKYGIDFKAYALNCARAFGACVTIRDDPFVENNIPDEFEVGDYHVKAAQKARTDLAILLMMPPHQREHAAYEEWRESEKHRLKRLDDTRKQRHAYEAMLAKVNAWTPPTPDHAGLHEFMRTQIEQSISFDCDDSCDSTAGPCLSGDQWAAKEEARLNHDIEYHEKEYAGEVARAASRTAWVRTLRASL